VHLNHQPTSSQALALGSEPVTALWFVRHAEVEEKYQNVFGGRIDMELSPRGHEQAAATARFLRGRQWDAIYASPMNRVRQSLAPVLADGAPAPIIVPGLAEMDFGDWTGLHWEEIERERGISAARWLEAIEDGSMTNAESLPALHRRVGGGLDEILARHPGGQVGVFCHGGVIRVAMAHLLGWPLRQLGAVELEYSSVTLVVCGGGKAHLRLLNLTPWRELGGS